MEDYMRTKIRLRLLILLLLCFTQPLHAATATSTGSGAWSTDIWDGGAGAGGVPADGDSVVIAAGHSVLMDADLSAWTGLSTVTIQGDDSTPGMLYFKDGTSGYLKLRTGYNIVGDSGTFKGRLLANSDGVWGHTGSLAYANKAVIDLNGTSRINAEYLDIYLKGTEPTNKFVRTYSAKFATSSINTETDVVTLGSSHGWSANRAVSVRSSGTLPEPLLADVVYYVGSPSGADLKLLYTSSGTAVDITSEGTGTIEVYSGYSQSAGEGAWAGVSTVNVLEDITSDSWSSTDGHDHVILADAGPVDVDYQRLQLNDISTAYSVTLSAALDSAQYPGARIVLVSRNVSVRGGGTGSTQAIIDYASATTAGGYFGCEIRNQSASGTTVYGYGVNSGTNHTISGTLTGNNTGVNSGTNHTISGTLTGNTYDFRGYGYSLKARNVNMGSAPTFYARNLTDGTVFRLTCENYLRVAGASYVFDNFGDVKRTAINSGGDAPTQNPSGTTTGDVIEALNIQSNCGALDIYDALPIMEDYRVWVTSGEKTVTFKVNTTYDGITAGNLKLTGYYTGVDGAMTEITAAPAISQRSSAIDWTQELSVTFTPSADGWVSFKIELMEYEANNEVYIWPVPTIE